MLTRENLDQLSSSSGSFDDESLAMQRIARVVDNGAGSVSVGTGDDIASGVSEAGTPWTVRPAPQQGWEWRQSSSTAGPSAAAATLSRGTAGSNTDGSDHRRIRPVSLLAGDSDSDSVRSMSVSHVDDDEGAQLVWYFAYGSNMNVAQLLTRVGAYQDKKLMWLDGFQLLFNKKATLRHTTNTLRQRAAFANVQPVPGHRVYGVAYLLRFDQLLQMDRYEGVKQGHYYREELTLECDGGGSFVTAWVYRACPEAVGEGLLPIDTYMSDLLGGRGLLPRPYVQMLEAQECLSGSAVARQMPF